VLIGRRNFVVLSVVSAAGWGRGVRAEEAYPVRSIRMIVPFPPGGVGDLIARPLADAAGRELGQPIVIDNRGGGNSVIGTTFAARAKPDGYTVLQMAAANVTITALQNVSYDLQRDFTPVIGIGESPLALVVPAALNINTVDELAAYAKSNPHGLTYASGGVGSLAHLSSLRLAREFNVPSTHVPYRGNSFAIESLLSGQTVLLFGAVIDVFEQVKAGKLKLLAVTSADRVASFPDVPTMTELGFKDFTPTLWYGYVVPAGTPGVAVDRLASAITKAASQPDLQARYAELGVTIKLTPGPAFGTFMRDEFVRWKQVIVENNIKLDG
jgi:tripartite-type tricarboxylate transporter receptor subunit TctC